MTAQAATLWWKVICTYPDGTEWVASWSLSQNTAEGEERAWRGRGFRTRIETEVRA